MKNIHVVNSYSFKKQYSEIKTLNMYISAKKF